MFAKAGFRKFGVARKFEVANIDVRAFMLVTSGLKLCGRPTLCIRRPKIHLAGYGWQSTIVFIFGDRNDILYALAALIEHTLCLSRSGEIHIFL